MLCSRLPFSAAEVLLYAGCLSLIIWTGVSVRRIVKGRMQGICVPRFHLAGRYVTWLAMWSGILILTYMLGCGINYHRLTFSQREGLAVSGAEREELVSLCEQLVRQINESAGAVQRRDDGSWKLTSDAPIRAKNAVERLGERYTSLDGDYPIPKSVLISRWLTVQQVTGIYSPFTMEANYNREVPAYEQAFSICHELSHLKGFMREDEANFIAWLACSYSDDPEFRYSGALTGFVYAGNALYRYDRELYIRLRKSLCDEANRDLTEVNRFWSRYDGKAAEAHEKVNDIYLKANAQSDGVESYGRMVELMLAYMRAAAV